MNEHVGMFDGLRVAAFESRRSGEMARLIERAGGIPHVTPAIREVPIENQAAAVAFAHHLIAGQIDVVILMTGVGVEYLVEAVQRHVDRERFLAALQDGITIARGPKPTAALRQLGVEATYQARSPNTWRDLLSVIDRHLTIAHQRVAVQEYGRTNRSLVAGLEARGAEVLAVPVYRWELPDDVAPLEQSLRALVEGQCDVILFTSAIQVDNLFRVAEGLDLTGALTGAMRSCMVASIGPTTSEAIRGYGVAVDFEPSHPKMGHLVKESSETCHALRRRKEAMVKMLDQPTLPSQDAPWHDSPFLKACRREPTEVTPVWLMRQAGRYLEEYRAIRQKVSFLELCKDPALCSQVMVETVERLGVDAAIIFSDLLPILEPMGLELEYAAGEGPVIHNPVREPSDVDRVVELESVDTLSFVVETVRQTRRDLPSHLPLIGFAGAPFTLASYMIEGGASRQYLHTKTLMYRDEGAWRALMERLSRAVTLYLNAQVAAGAQCVQLFDSWAGCLGPTDYQRYVLPYVRSIVQGVTPGIPVINFATGNPALLADLAAARPSVVGVDWRIRLDQAWQVVGHETAVQGNLDPATLLADRNSLLKQVNSVMRQAAGRRGHIFNLGHGVLPQTPVDHVLALIDAVHEYGTVTE